MKFGIIGFGNLGRALASGLILSDSAGAGDVHVCDSSPEARLIAENDYCSPTTDDVNHVIANSDILFLTVKGCAFEELSKAIEKRRLVGKTVVSCMAGVTFEEIYSLLGNVTLVRAMPSLSIATCEGIIGYTKAPVSVAILLKKLGLAIEAEPEFIEKFMAFSACGLGYAAYLIDAFAAAGEAMGFSLEIATHIAALSFKQAGDRGNFRETVKAVATPDGATEQGISYMDELGVYGIVAGAIQKAYERMT
jgi:pyrroline-5-carboxylate reductase